MEVTYSVAGYEVTMTDSEFIAYVDGQAIVAESETELLDRLHDT